ncbi:MAG: hypothetical protein AAF557_14350 [Pseudomonadota bacterium]
MPDLRSLVTGLLCIVALAGLLGTGLQAMADDAQDFQDPNFKLTVISALMENGELTFDAYPEFLKQIEGSQYDYEKDGYRLSTPAYQHFVDLKISADQLATIQALVFDGGLEIYPYVYPFWGGETEDFDITSLRDLRHLPNLQRFEIVSMLSDTDLAPLKGAQQLRSISLGLVKGSWKNLNVLLDLPALGSVQVFDTNITTPAQRAVLDKLAGQGVAVSIF